MGDTPCKDCCFAIYEGVTQTGCAQDRLKYYKDSEILEAYDEEREFYVLSGTCVFKRTDEWKRQVADAGLTVVERLKKEITLPYQAIIICNDDVDDVLNTFHSLEHQESIPWRITLVSKYQSKLNLAKHVIPHIRNTKIPWRTEGIINPAYTERQRIIDLCLRHNPLPYFTVFDAGFVVPPDTFLQLGQKILQERFCFGALAPNSKDQGLLIPYSVYQHYKITNPSYSTIDALIEDEQCKEIYNITDIVPNFPK